MRYEWLPGGIVVSDGVPVARVEQGHDGAVVVLPDGRHPGDVPPDGALLPGRGRRLRLVREGRVVATVEPARPLSRRPLVDCEEPLAVLDAVRMALAARRRWTGSPR